MMTGPQIEELHRALTAAFDRPGLDFLLRFYLDVRLDRIVSPSQPYWTVVYELIQAAERAGWLTELIEAAYRAQPGHPLVARVFEQTGLAPQVDVMSSGEPADSGGFAKVLRHLPFTDITLWRERLLQVEGRVCRVEVGNGVMGTGFLVGPDVVLTCYSVLEPVIRQKKPDSALQVRFDYRVLVNGQVQEGVVVPMAPNGVIDWSPYAPAESAGDWDKDLPTKDELDYVLFRLARRVGEEPINPIAPEGPRRGWIPVPLLPPPIVPHMPLLLAQHAQAGPLKLALDMDGVIGVNANGTRVRYANITEAGSAGSPCFDFQWALIAVHHASDPAWDRPKKWSQGIPIAAIRDRLARLGKDDALGGDPP
jgi:hypothetical protein